ncbi:MAG: hypothetical protein HGA49_04415 [Eubacteriaceae bacterium]|nr:hypothetical protein [Eubacteriaceae bacterium]
MKLKNLIRHLPIIDRKFKDKAVMEKEIKGVLALEDFDEKAAGSTVFFCGKWDSFPNVYEGVIITDHQEIFDALVSDSLLLVKTGKLEYTVNIIKELIENDEFISQYRNTVFEDMLDGKDIQGVMKHTYECLGNPVIFTDSTYRLVTMYPYEKTADPVRNSILKKGYADQELMMQIESDRTKEETLKRDFPSVLDWGFAKDLRRISRVVADGNKIFGVIGVAETNRPFRETDIEIVEIFSKVIRTMLINKSSPSDEKQVYMQTLLANLIEGDIYTSVSLKKALSMSDIKWHAPYVMITVPLDINKFGIETIKKIQDDIQSGNTKMQSMIHNANIVFLSYGSLRNEEKRKIDAILTVYDLVCGVSDEFSDLLKATLYYRQALIAYRYGSALDSKERKYYFNDFRDKYLYDCVEEMENTSIFVYPPVYELLKYDQKCKTELSATLLAYLQNYKNAASVSEVLHIHRNTLIYRIKKAEEIMDIDLNNNLICRHIQKSLEILSNKI